MLSKEELERIITVNPPSSKDITKEKVIDMLYESRALIKGHYELLSGDHSDIFFRFGLIARHNGYRGIIAKEIAKKFKKDYPDAIMAPITAGGSLLVELTSVLESRPINIEKDDKGKPSHLQDGYFINKGDRILIVNDLTNTGSGLRMMINIAKQNEAKLIGIGLFLSRSDKVIQDLKQEGINIHVLVNLKVEQWKREDCTLCKEGVKLEYSRNLNI